MYRISSYTAVLYLCIKFIYSEKATKFYEIFTIDLSYVVSAMVEISQNFVAFSEYMNFMHSDDLDGYD